MKRILLFIILSCVMVSCATTRKAKRETDEMSYMERTDSQAATNVHTTRIDTSWFDSGTMTHTIITFEPDTMPAAADADTHVNVGGVDIKLPNTSRIKSIENTTISHDTGGQLVTTDSDSTATQTQSHDVAMEQKHEREQVTTKRTIPFRLYVYASIVLGILVFVLLKRHRIADFIRRVIQFARTMI